MITFTTMVREIGIEEFLKASCPLVDVRSPGEFTRGHIPGAVNIPLFTDAERARVGTIYTQVSAGKAMEAGLLFVRPKLLDFIRQSEEAAPGGIITVHCWRGGMRSREFASLLSENGFREVYMITGGYKAFRNYIHAYFNTPLHLKIIGGYTGSGKTEILRCLRDLGHQVVDLEALACHKGSSFGGLGQGEQPTTEQFENNLFDEFNRLDFKRPVWLEDESHNIGGVNLPLNLYRQMKQSVLFFLDIPREERAAYLVDAYAHFEPEPIADSLQRISKRLGGSQFMQTMKFLEERKFHELTLLVLSYYDKTYRNGLRLHQQEKIRMIKCDSTDPQENVRTILKTDETIAEY